MFIVIICFNKVVPHNQNKFSNLIFFHILPHYEQNESNLKNFTCLKFEKSNYVHN